MLHMGCVLSLSLDAASPSHQLASLSGPEISLWSFQGAFAGIQAEWAALPHAIRQLSVQVQPAVLCTSSQLGHLTWRVYKVLPQ